MLSPSNSTMNNSQDLLPPELWLKIFSFSSPIDLYSSISASCLYFYRLVSFHQESLPRIRVSIRAWVQDDSERTVDKSLHSSITYAISVDDHTTIGFSKGGRRIDPRMKMIFVSYSGGKMKIELENREGNIENMNEEVLLRILSWMEVVSLIVEVRKGGMIKSSRRFDDTLIIIMQWITNNFGAVALKSMLLSSHNSSFEWRPNEKSIELIASLPLESLTVENMPSIEILSSLSIPSIVLRLSHTHKKPRNRLQFYIMDREYFTTLLHSFSPICHNLYSDVPYLLSMVTAADLADFIMIWRSSLSPSLIINLSFNCIVSLSDFRSIFPSKGLDQILDEIPYCRYRTAHPVHNNLGLELSCCGNGLSTQWQIRASEMSLLV